MNQLQLLVVLGLLTAGGVGLALAMNGGSQPPPPPLIVSVGQPVIG